MEVQNVSHICSRKRKHGSDNISPPALPEDLSLEPQVKCGKQNAHVYAETLELLTKHIETSVCKSQDEKMESLTNLFNELDSKNVNILLVKPDFFDWAKTTLADIVRTVNMASGTFIDFMMSAIKVVPALVEGIVDFVLNICFFHCENCDIPKRNILILRLLSIFKKLRRVPKFIAKLLCCYRDNIFKRKKASAKRKELLPMDLLLELGECISALTQGQISDLWKTLYYNIDTECVSYVSKDIKEFLGRKKFMFLVIEIIKEFLYNLNVSDFCSTGGVGKVFDIMENINEILRVLGEAVTEVPDYDVVECFLTLSLAWGEINMILLNYSTDYFNKKENYFICEPNDNPANLSPMFEFLSGDKWLFLESMLANVRKQRLCSSWVKLIILKIQFYALMNSNGRISIEEFKGHRSSMVDYIAQICKEWLLEIPSEDFKNIERYITPQCISVPGFDNVITNGAIDIVPQKFHFLRILKSCRDILEEYCTIKKTNFLLSEILDHLNFGNNESIIHRLLTKNTLDEAISVDVLSQVLVVVNKIVTTYEFENLDFKLLNVDKIEEELRSLCDLNMEIYPKSIKTLGFMVSALIMKLPIENSITRKLCDPASMLFCATASNSQGNTIIFSFDWTEFLKYILFNACPGVKLKPTLLKVVFENIYMSSKIITKFEVNVLDDALKNCVDMKDQNFEFILYLAEYLVKRLNEKKNKDSNSYLREHLKKSVKFCSKLASEAIPSEEILCHIFRASYIILSSKTFNLDVETNDTVMTNNTACVVDFLTKQTVKKDGVECPAFGYAMQFLALVCKDCYEAFPKSCSLIELWKICSDSLNPGRKVQLESQVVLLRRILEVCTEREFRKISKVVRREMRSVAELSDVACFSILTSVNCMLDCDIDIGKARIRRQLLQKFLTWTLLFSCNWKSEDLSEINFTDLMRLHLKILRRRKPLVNLRFHACSMGIISNIPLLNVDIEVFKHCFTTVGEVLNACAFHRQDVILNRSHVYIQSFQHLVDALVDKADQNNQLSQSSLYDLAQCSHLIERICQSMKTGEAQLSRVAPFCIATIVMHFEQHTLYPNVKLSLLGGLNKLLDICNEKAIGQLNSLLSVGCKEIMKGIFEQYKKFYKYKGKV